jgi:hypothetical protein
MDRGRAELAGSFVEVRSPDRMLRGLGRLFFFTKTG